MNVVRPYVVGVRWEIVCVRYGMRLETTLLSLCIQGTWTQWTFIIGASILYYSHLNQCIQCFIFESVGPYIPILLLLPTGEFTKILSAR